MESLAVQNQKPENSTAGSLRAIAASITSSPLRSVFAFAALGLLSGLASFLLWGPTWVIGSWPLGLDIWPLPALYFSLCLTFITSTFFGKRMHIAIFCSIIVFMAWVVSLYVPGYGLNLFFGYSNKEETYRTVLFIVMGAIGAMMITDGLAMIDPVFRGWRRKLEFGLIGAVTSSPLLIVGHGEWQFMSLVIPWQTAVAGRIGYLLAKQAESRRLELEAT